MPLTEVPNTNQSSDLYREERMITMRDGIQLATDICFPEPIERLNKNEAKWPVLLERTPYNKRGLNRSECALPDLEPKNRIEVAEFFANRGYVVVIQDCRGRYASQGNFVKYINEAEDGFDTISWLKDQPWCNGKIGTFGISYGAHTQLAAACLNPPGLSSMFLDSGGFASAYHGGIRRGGAFEMKQVTWAYRHAILSPETKQDPHRQMALENVNLENWFSKFPWYRGQSPLAAAPEFEDYIFEQWEEGEYTDYWKQLGLSALEQYGNIPDVPILMLNSWYDPYVSNTVRNYLGLSEGRTQPCHVVMGPWTHGCRSFSHAGDVEFGQDAIFENRFGQSYLEYRAAWFDHYLKGQKSDCFALKNSVRLFVMGGRTEATADQTGRLNHGGNWITNPHWHTDGDDQLCLYFDQQNMLLAEKPKATQSSLKIQFDPSNPTPTIGGSITSGEPIMRGGPYDQREREDFFGCEVPGRKLSERKDVLSFTTEELSEDIIVSGSIKADIWVSSNCADSDIAVKLIDEYPPSADFPDGYAMNLTDGIVRLRYRNGGEKTEFLDADEIYRVEIDIPATANRFCEGHRIRVDISSASFPQFDINSNSGEKEGNWDRMEVACNKIYLDRHRPSQIALPILKVG